MYNTYEDFQDTSIYRKIGTRVKTIKPPKKFESYMSGSIPGQERVSELGMGESRVLINTTYLQNTVKNGESCSSRGICLVIWHLVTIIMFIILIVQTYKIIWICYKHFTKIGIQSNQMKL